MKKYIYIGLVTLLALCMAGCKEEIKESEFHTDTIDLNTTQDEWEFDEMTGQFFRHFDISEITQQVYDNGNWTVSREYEKGTSTAYQVALPISIFCFDTLPDKSIAYYTEYIDYRLGVGYVEIQLTHSDYLYFADSKGNLIKPDGMDFRLQLMY